MTFQRGDIVLITKAESPYCYKGDIATLLFKSNEHWKADLTTNEYFYGNGRWFLNNYKVEFEFYEKEVTSNLHIFPR